MSKKVSKKEIVKISRKVLKNEPLSQNEISKLREFKLGDSIKKFEEFFKKAAIVFSTVFAGLIVMFPDVVAQVVETSDPVFFLNERIALGLDYVWSLVGNPTEQTHILYHVPNIVVYSFGILGLKTLIEIVNKKGANQTIAAAKELIEQKIIDGNLTLSMRKGHAILFLGNGDFVGESLANATDIDAVALSSKKPATVDIWNCFDLDSGIELLKEVLIKSDAKDAGEYLFFPSTDTELFLPGHEDYDLAPYRMDIIIRDIRIIEKELGWPEKRIIILGDKQHVSVFETADYDKTLPNSREDLTFFDLTNKHTNVSILDPSELVINTIISKANGAKILFRSSDEGIKKYKSRFFETLNQLGYLPDSKASNNKVLTIGYDLYEPQTEQQSVSNKDKEYLPVIFSQMVFSRLLNQGYKADRILYIPDLILEQLKIELEKQ